MTEQDVIPLFATEVKGKMLPAVPKVTDKESTYKTSSFVDSLASEIETATDELTCGKRAGEMTVAAYVLLESLHRTGLQSLADMLLDSPTALQSAALYCAIGLNAGRMIPDGVKFTTAESESSLSLRDINGGDDKEGDKTSDG